MRDVLREEKMHLKANEVIHMEIPAYAELSVKNLYNDVMADAILSKY